MHRPAGRDLEAHVDRALEEAPWLARDVEPLKKELEEERFEEARARIPTLRAALERAELSEPARRSAERGLTDVDDGLSGDAYWRAPAWKRVAVIVAGPGTNLLFAIALLAVVFMLGVPESVRPTVAKVESGMPAARFLEEGDRVVAIDGRPVGPEQISERIRASGGDPIRLTVVRDGGRMTFTATPVAEEVPGLDEPVYRLGFSLEPVYKKRGPLDAVGLAADRTWLVTKVIFQSLGRIVTGEGRDEVASPVGIVQASGEALEVGVRDYLGVLALISLSLALLNMLPLLPLDGGHIAFSLAEAVRGRAIPREAYERVSAVGIVLVLLLFFIGLSNDIERNRGG
jgi:regulator of sigma E protease